MPKKMLYASRRATSLYQSDQSVPICLQQALFKNVTSRQIGSAPKSDSIDIGVGIVDVGLVSASKFETDAQKVMRKLCYSV